MRANPSIPRRAPRARRRDHVCNTNAVILAHSKEKTFDPIAYNLHDGYRGEPPKPALPPAPPQPEEDEPHIRSRSVHAPPLPRLFLRAVRQMDKAILRGDTDAAWRWSLTVERQLDIALKKLAGLDPGDARLRRFAPALAAMG